MFRKYFTRKSIGIPILFTIPSPRFFLLSILFIADNMPCEYKKTREFSRLTVLKSPSKRFLLFTFRVCSRYRCVWCSATGKEIDGRGRNDSRVLRLLLCENGAFEIFRRFFFLFFFPSFSFFLTNWIRCLFALFLNHSARPNLLKFIWSVERGVMEFLDRAECKFLFGNRFNLLNLKFIWNVGMMRFERSLRSFEVWNIELWLTIIVHLIDWTLLEA